MKSIRVVVCNDNETERMTGEAWFQVMTVLSGSKESVPVALSSYKLAAFLDRYGALLPEEATQRLTDIGAALWRTSIALDEGFHRRDDLGANEIEA